MHPIQKDIFFKLITNNCLPYSKLKPQNVEGNLFTYHLKQVIKEGLVEKKVNGLYDLTQDGRIFADTISLKTLRVRAQPKIVSLLVCQNSKGEYLLYKRKRQPFFDLIGFPSGKIHLGESITQAAHRELEESTGLQANLSHKGLVYMSIFQNQDLLIHRLYHIFTANNPSGILLPNAKFGECFWGKITKPTDKKYMTGFKEIYEMTKEQGTHLLFKELTFHL